MGVGMVTVGMECVGGGFIWAGEPRPYGWVGDDDYAVDMIRHDDECIGVHGGEMARDVLPPSKDAFTIFIQANLATHDFPEQARPIVRTDANEICSGLGVIVPLQSDGSAVMPGWVVSHRCRLLRNFSASCSRSSPEMSFGSSVSRRAARVKDSLSLAFCRCIIGTTVVSNAT